MKKALDKKILGLLSLLIVLTLVLTACDSETESDSRDSNYLQTENAHSDESDHERETVAGARAVYELDRLVIDETEEIYHGHGTPFDHATLTFIGEEQGGNVLIQIGDVVIQASINPSREHPSYEEGYWHHHLYAGSTEPGSLRINFMELLPELGIDDNEEADDNTQSIYQRGNLHYVVETGEFRLRFTIDGVIHDLMFREV